MNVLLQTKEFSEWLHGLRDLVAKARVVARLSAAEVGNVGECAPVGDGVSEMKIHAGPGYRVYYTRAGDVIYVLLCGGNKSTQKADIQRAKAMARQARKE
jgi:putative addiction module killer protein